MCRTKSEHIIYSQFMIDEKMKEVALRKIQEEKKKKLKEIKDCFFLIREKVSAKIKTNANSHIDWKMEMNIYFLNQVYRTQLMKDLTQIVILRALIVMILQTSNIDLKMMILTLELEMIG